MVKELLDGIHLLIVILIFARAISSFVPHMNRHPIVLFINTVTEPILAPFRNILPQSRQIGIDFSPLLALLVIDAIYQLLYRLL